MSAKLRTAALAAATIGAGVFAIALVSGLLYEQAQRARDRAQTVKPDPVEQLRRGVLRVIDQLRNPRRPFPVAGSKVKEERWIGPVDQHQAGHLGGIEARVDASIQGGR